MKRNRILALLAIVVLVLGGVIATSFAAVTDSSFIAAPEKTLVQGVDYEYSFAVLGDTQCISLADAKKDTAYTEQIFNWITQNKESKNIQYVMGLGDITNTFKSSDTYYSAEWQIAKETYGILENSGIPYSLVRGNHDISSGMNDTFGKGTEYYDSIIALSQATDSEGRPMGGFAPEYTDESKTVYKIENAYRKVETGGDKWIIVTLDWAPTEATLVWLADILEANPDYRAIVTLHQFLQKDGAIIDDAEGTLPHENIGDANWGEVPTGGTVHPRVLWDTVLRKYANVEMIISGHIPVDGIVRTQYMGDNGNTVTCMLIDPQEMDEVLSTPVGMIAMLYFSADGNVVHVEYISAVRDIDGKTAYRGADNQFSMPLEYADGWVKTEYGYAPKTDYDSATFLTFLDDDGDPNTDSVYLGAYNEWVDAAGSGGVQPMVRTQFTYGGASIRQKKTLSVLMMKDYDGTSDGKYQYIGDVCGTLRLDLNGKTFTNGKYPMLAAYTRTTYNTNTFEVVNGAVKLTSAGIFAIQTASGGNGGVINAKLADLNISYAEGGTASTPIVTTYPGTSGKTSSAKLELTDCNIDAYNNAPSSVTLFNLSGDSDNNTATVTVNGGSITAANAASLYKLNSDDRFVFGNGSAALILPVGATAPTAIYENAKGEKLAFYEKDRDGNLVTYALEAYKTPAGSLGVIDVWLIAGQSNAAGYAIDMPTDAHSDSRFTDGFADVLYYGMADDNAVTAFTPVKVGQGKSVTSSGAEIGIASMLSGNGNMNAVIKLGRGSSYLYPDTGNNVSKNYGTWTSPSYIKNNGISTDGNKIGDLYEEFVATVAEGIRLLEAEGYTPVIRGMWWMQGEAEMWREALANEYEAMLTAFIGDIRSDLSVISGEDLSSMPFIIGVAGVNKATNADGTFVYDQPTYAETVAEAQRIVAGKVANTSCVETKDLARRDQWHFTADVQQYLGEQFVSAVVALEGKYSVTVNGSSVAMTGGGAYEAGSTVTVTLTPENGFVIDRVTFTVGLGEAVEITLGADGSYSFTMPEGNVVITVTAHDPNMVDTVYGTIPSKYSDTQKYPFAVFKNGEFYNVYSTWNDVLRAGASILTAETPNATLLLRRDYSTDEDEASIQDLYTHEGNLTIDLGGHTLTRGAYHLFQVMSKKESAKARPTNIKVINGTIQTKNSCPIAVNSRDGALADHFYFEFDGVTFKYASGSTSGNMIMVTYTNGAVDTQITTVFKNCTFDLTDAPACTIFGLAEGSGNAKTAYVTIENSTFVAPKLSGISLYNAVGNDKLVFGEGVTFRLPSAYEVGDTVYTDTNGVSYGLVALETVGSETVYTIAPVDTDSVTTKYGVIPSEYSSATAYPFVVFDQNGKFFGAYDKWDTFLAAGGKILTSSNKKATLLVRRDYATSENASSSQNWYTFSGSILMDMDGHTVTIDAKSHLFQFINKCTKDTTTEITIINGTIVTYKNYTPFIINGHANSKADYTVDLTCNGVTFVYHKSSTVKKLLLDTFASGTTASNFNALFNDCVFDISQAAHAVTLFNAKESGGTVKAANITINGGILKAPKFSYITFAALGTGDTMVFGKNTLGNYLALSMPEGQTVTATTAYNGADGEILYFTATEKSGEYVLALPHVHSYNAVVTAPTCTVGGYTTYTCACGDSYVADYTEAIGHAYDDEYDADCNNCGEIREVEIPVYVVAEGKCGVNTTWVLTSDGVLTISGNGDTEDYLVSITTEQPYRAYQAMITKVVFENGITSIGRGAFYGFTNITEVVFPESLIAIHEYAFFGCNGIKSVTIPENTFYVGMYAFRKSGLTSINFANANGWTFADGTALDVTNVKAFTTEFTYKQTCIRPVYEDGDVIAEGIFGNKDQFTWTLTSTGLLTVSGKGNMPKFNVNTTPWYGYRGAIRSVVIEEGITSVGRCAFHTCRAITSVTLPESLETIAEYAFYNCQFLTEATIPANVTRIEIYAFRKCFALKDVTFTLNYGWTAGNDKVSATELNSNAADMLTLVNYTKIWTRDVNAEEEILDPNYVTGGACNTTVKWALTYVDDSKTSMKLTISGTGAMPKFETAGTPWYAYLNNIVEVEVCEGITEIGRCSFYGLKFVKVATIADTVTSINDYAFSGCFSLKSIDIPASVTYIADTAFTKTGLSEIPTV